MAKDVIRRDAANKGLANDVPPPEIGVLEVHSGVENRNLDPLSAPRGRAHPRGLETPGELGGVLKGDQSFTLRPGNLPIGKFVVDLIYSVPISPQILKGQPAVRRNGRIRDVLWLDRRNRAIFTRRCSGQLVNGLLFGNNRDAKLVKVNSITPG
jgi:hypothetical protein